MAIMAIYLAACLTLVGLGIGAVCEYEERLDRMMQMSNETNESYNW